MIVYFADKNLNITGQANTSLPGGFRILEDKLTEEIASGVNIFEFKVSYNDMTRAELDSIITRSKYVLKSGGNAFTSSENSYNALFQIIDDEFDTLSQEYSVYCEDAGLDLINKIVPEIEFKDKTLRQMLNATVPNDWTINIIDNPNGTKTNEYDGESTATERINNIVALFGCEVYYSFELERFKIIKKIINVVSKRGHQVAIPQLRLNRDINQIVTKRSRKELATAYAVKGGVPEGKETPITLVGYTYKETDKDTGDVYEVDKSTGQMRNISAMAREASAIDGDGLIIKTFDFDTTDKKVLAGQAKAELRKHCNPIVEYEVDILNLPDGTTIGDRINIIDEEGKLYLDARIIKLESSVTDEKITATVGDYIYRDSGISEQMRNLAKEYAGKGVDGIVLSITSSGGNIFHGQPIKTILTATVFQGNNVIDTKQALEAAFGETAEIRWYNGNNLLGAGMTFAIESENTKETITARLET
ncbi:MAG: phage tail spike protein [Bacillota bacterium]|nr:phage tail spike protein [Bacillota bacterium]